MRWWHHLWHTPLSCQWGSRSRAFGILSPDPSLFSFFCSTHSSPFSLFLWFPPQCSHQWSFSAQSTWQHIILCLSILSLLWANESDTEDTEHCHNNDWEMLVDCRYQYERTAHLKIFVLSRFRLVWWWGSNISFCLQSYQQLRPIWKPRMALVSWVPLYLRNYFMTTGWITLLVFWR